MRLIAALLTVLALAGCVSRTGAPADESAPDTETDTETEAETDTEADVDGCEFVVDDPTASHPFGPPPNEPVSATEVALRTSSGDLTISLAEDTPCTVRNFVHLTDEGFYDGSVCHRLTTSDGLKVLQCGDPAGDGTGGPGYTIPDELPTDLADAPTDPSGQPLKIYPRGTVAMANAGPDTGGSQFFMVYADSTLPPNYAVFGTVDATGLATLDTIAARGIGPGGRSPEDGTPAQEVEIESATAR